MKYPGANLLVVRKVFRTLKDSCYSDLLWAINRFGVGGLWDAKASPLEITFKPTGQKVLFRGLDDPLKIASIAVPNGALCWLWIEEAFEITREADFDMLDESIRGEIPGGLFKQITLTLNPWDERHWIKKRFFDVKDLDVFAITTTYLCNEWLDNRDRVLFERMKERNPRRYQVAGLGNWGVIEGLIYDNWREETFDLDEICKLDGVQSAFGLDFGFTTDPTALFCGIVCTKSKKIWVFDELYEKGLINRAIYKRVEQMGIQKERIAADSAEPKSIEELRRLGIHKIHGVKKGPDSVRYGIQALQDFEIIIHRRCVNFLREISTYTWDVDRFEQKLNRPSAQCEDHLMDAMRYGMERFTQTETFSWD